MNPTLSGRCRIGFAVALGFAVAVGACSADNSGGGAAASDAGSASDGSAVAPSDAGAGANGASGTSPNGELSIVHVASTVNTLTENANPTESDSAEFVAIVTDKAGLDSIAGGTLEDDTGVTYGAFSAGANKGTYVADVTFDQINSIRKIDFPQAGGSRTFVVRFIDNAGNVVTASESLDLRCRLPPALSGQSIEPNVAGLVGACGGTCTDLNDDPNNCGACGTSTCATVDGGSYIRSMSACLGGTCATQGQTSACLAVEDQPTQTCDAACASLGAGVKCDYVSVSTDNYSCQYAGHGGRASCSVPFGSLMMDDTTALSVMCACGQ